MHCKGRRTSLEILLVGKYKQQGVLHFPVLNDTGELGSCLVDTVAVVGVNDEDKTLGACTSCQKRYSSTLSKEEELSRVGSEADSGVAVRSLPGTLPSRPHIPEK